MIITIDGPAGSGKSSTARAVARRLGFRHLDSGAFYRALTLAALREGAEPSSWHALTPEQLDAWRISARPCDDGFVVLIDGAEAGDALRSTEVNAHVSAMARVPAVRTWLLGRLRLAAEGVDLVSDGRDVGTVVFPDADLKVFLVAAPRTRARRRLREQGTTAPTAAELAAEVARITERDRIDSQREVAPRRKAAEAVEIDTTALDFDEQVERIVALARARGAGQTAPGD